LTLLAGLWVGLLGGGAFAFACLAAGAIATLVAACLGALGGLGFGLVGLKRRGPLGWGLAGVIGGFLSGVPLMVVFGGLSLRSGFSMGQLMVTLATGMGGVVGIVVGCGIQRGQSRLPQVTELAAALREEDRRVLAAREDRSSELLPASVPTGRGDEPTP
jgi:hypothetical protein